MNLKNKKHFDPEAGMNGGGQTDVTESVAQSPAEQIAEASASDAAIDGEHAEASQASETPAPEVEQSAQSNGKDYNWRQMREQLRQRDAQIKALEGAANIDKWLKSNPGNMRVIMDLMEGKSQQAQAPQQAMSQTPAAQEDPYADFDPVVAEKFRKLDAFEQWKAELDRQNEQQKASQQKQEQESIQKNMNDLDSSFDEVLVKDGYMGEDGSGDIDLIEMIQDATLARLARKFGDPTRATRAQMLETYKAVTAGLSAHQKFTLKKTVKQDVPLSGSTRGTVPTGKTTMSEHDRVSTLIDSL